MLLLLGSKVRPSILALFVISPSAKYRRCLRLISTVALVVIGRIGAAAAWRISTAIAAFRRAVRIFLVPLDVDRRGVVEVQVTGDWQNAGLPEMSNFMKIQRLKGSSNDGCGKG